MAQMILDEITWNGLAGCTVEGTVTPEDPSVGIMGPGLESVTLTGPDGIEILLTAEDETKLLEQVQPQVSERYYKNGDEYN